MPETRPISQTESLGGSTPLKIDTGKVPPAPALTLSFRYWTEVNDFQLGSNHVSITSQWVKSLISVFKDIQSRPIEEVLKDPAYRQRVRFKQIDIATSANLGITVSDWVNCLPNRYKHNYDELGVYELHVSKGRGRLIGILNKEYLLDVILIDLNHNFCLVNFKGATRVKPTFEVLTPLEEIQRKMLKIISIMEKANVEQNLLAECKTILHEEASVFEKSFFVDLATVIKYETIVESIAQVGDLDQYLMSIIREGNEN